MNVPDGIVYGVPPAPWLTGARTDGGAGGRSAGLPRHVRVQHRDLELSVVPAALAAILMLLSLIAAARGSSLPS